MINYNLLQCLNKLNKGKVPIVVSATIGTGYAVYKPLSEQLYYTPHSPETQVNFKAIYDFFKEGVYYGK